MYQNIPHLIQLHSLDLNVRSHEMSNEQINIHIIFHYITEMSTSFTYHPNCLCKCIDHLLDHNSSCY